MPDTEMIKPSIHVKTYHLIEVKQVECLDGYKLKLLFDNGVKKVVDLEKEMYREVFEPLRDINLFRQVRVDPEIGTICWPNNADFAADTLYEIGVDS